MERKRGGNIENEEKNRREELGVRIDRNWPIIWLSKNPLKNWLRMSWTKI